MKAFSIHSKTAWEDYFPVTTLKNLSSQTYTSKQTPSSTGVYVSNCLFNFIKSSGDGGALLCTSVTYLLVESSSFFSCNTSGQNGGAIYFYNRGSGQCVLYEVCGNDCFSTYTSGSSLGQFARIDVSNGATSKNYVNYSSITRCVNERSNSYYTLCLIYGNICCPSVNISMNKCSYFSGFCCNPFGDSNTITFSLSYSSFADNSANECGCIGFYDNSAKCEIKSCNILRNTQGALSSNGIVFTSGNTMIEDSCILENKADYIFYAASSSYTITLSNCTVDKTTNNRNLVTQNTVTKSFILALNHMSTRNCHSEYDSAGSLTAIPYVSHRTNKLFCYTNELNQYHARISDLFTLIWVFIVTFIQTHQ
jgi:hypothetical protein